MTFDKIPDGQSKSILLVSDFLFQPTTTGNRKRVASLVTAIKSWGYSVHMTTLDGGFPQNEIDSTAKLVDGLELIAWKPEIDPYGLPSATTVWGRLLKKLVRGLRKAIGHWPPALDPDLEDRCPKQFRVAVQDRVEQLRPIAVIVEYIWLSRCLVDLPGDTHRIIDTHDLMHLRLRQYRGAGLYSFFQCTLEDELKCLRRADSVLVIQQHEMEVLSAYLPLEALVLTPHGHELKPPAKRRRGKQLLFLGSSHAANVEGLKWFLAKVWPLIRVADSEVQLQIVGTAGLVLKNNQDFGESLNGVEICGLVEDVISVLCQADILINPILRGSGLKIKVVEALCCGLPVVSTSKGVEGICRNAECESVAVADRPEEFCHMIMCFLSSDADLEMAALDFCSTQFSFDSAYGQLKKLLTSTRHLD